jgi:hypothetical protein
MLRRILLMTPAIIASVVFTACSDGTAPNEPECVVKAPPPKPDSSC